MIRKNQVAPKLISGVVSDTSTLQVEGGNPIWVYGIIVGKVDITATAANISMKSGDGLTTFFTIKQANQINFVLDIPFKADKGLSFTGEATPKQITVFYMGPGV